MPKSDKQQQILDAALELFVERGFHGTAVPLIAERASVGAGTIYRYFEDKNALGNHLFRHWKSALAAELAPALHQPGPWRRRFGKLWQALAGFSRAHPGALEYLELQLHADYLDDESRALELAVAGALFAFIAEAQADEAVVDLPAIEIVALTYGAFLGLLRAAHTGWLTLDDAAVARGEERAWAMIRR